MPSADAIAPVLPDIRPRRHLPRRLRPFKHRRTVAVWRTEDSRAQDPAYVTSAGATLAVSPCNVRGRRTARSIVPPDVNVPTTSSWDVQRMKTLVRRQRRLPVLLRVRRPCAPGRSFRLFASTVRAPATVKQRQRQRCHPPRHRPACRPHSSLRTARHIVSLVRRSALDAMQWPVDSASRIPSALQTRPACRRTPQTRAAALVRRQLRRLRCRASETAAVITTSVSTS